MEKFIDPEFIKFFIPLAGAVVAWFLNEYHKQKTEEYLRKEARYVELLKTLKGFYDLNFVDNDEPLHLKNEFIEQLNRCWLYCPDEVIKKGYAFLATVHVDNISENLSKEEALGEFVLSIRKDLLSHSLLTRTKLSSIDFKIYTPNKKSISTSNATYSAF